MLEMKAWLHGTSIDPTEAKRFATVERSLKAELTRLSACQSRTAAGQAAKQLCLEIEAVLDPDGALARAATRWPAEPLEPVLRAAEALALRAAQAVELVAVMEDCLVRLGIVQREAADSMHAFATGYIQPLIVEIKACRTLSRGRSLESDVAAAEEHLAVHAAEQHRLRATLLERARGRLPDAETTRDLATSLAMLATFAQDELKEGNRTSGEVTDDAGRQHLRHLNRKVRLGRSQSAVKRRLVIWFKLRSASVEDAC
jgi:hypothetical protein